MDFPDEIAALTPVPAGGPRPEWPGLRMLYERT